MPSDEKRREVAQALRNNLKYMIRKEEWYGKDLHSNACGNAAYRNIAASVEDCGNLIDGNYIHIVETLADLIDRPTCQMKSTPESGYRVCSRCWAFVREDAVTDCTEAILVRFCPNCGAAVADTLDASKVDGK